MKKFIALILISLILILLVVTWGDKFENKNFGAPNTGDYFINYADLKAEYISDNSHLNQKNIDRYDLSYAASKIEDYDFEKYIIDQTYKERDKEYKNRLIRYYLKIKDYDQAEEIYYELNGPLVISDENKINKIERYEDLIDIYYGQKNKEGMESIFQMAKEEKDLRGESYMSQLGNESLSKIIEITENKEIKDEIMTQAVEDIQNEYDLIFILEETGYGSYEMEAAMKMVERLVKKGQEASEDFKSFLYFYPVFEGEKLVELYSDLLITELNNTYKLRYFKDNGKIEVTNQIVIDKPISYELYKVESFVIKGSEDLLLVKYEDRYLIKEKKGAKLVETIMEDDLIIKGRTVGVKGLDLLIEVEGNLKSKDLLLENGLILELVRFEKDGKLTDVILKEYEVLDTGYVKLLNMKKII